MFNDRLHVFEDNAMNYIALQHGYTYYVFDHDMSDSEIEEYVRQFEEGSTKALLDYNNGLVDGYIVTCEQFEKMTKLNHRVW